MSFEINVDLAGLDEVEKKLGRLDPLPTSEILEGIAKMVQSQTRARFYNKIAPDGSRWTPNREGTSTLLRTRALHDSIDYAVTGESAVVGSGSKYAGPHQHGAVITPKKAKRLVFRLGNKTVFAKKVTIPARPFLGLSDENKAHILDQVARFLQARIG